MRRDPSPGRRRIVVLALALVVSGCGGAGRPTGLPVDDDFSDCSTGWSTDSDEFVALSCTDGAYRVLIGNPLRPQNARIFFDTGVATLDVEADTTRQTGPKTIGGEQYLAYGVGCWASLVKGYVFLISPDGAWGIERFTSGASLPTTVAESPASDAIPGLRATNRVRGVCVGGGARPTRLALYVNGKLIAAASDRAGFDAFPGFGFFVYTSKPHTDVRFDNFVARRPTQPEVRAVARAAVKPLVSKLCKADGVRYVGATAAGAEVCFTLGRDGRSLIETAFSFVAASGCPDGAEGDVKSDYPGEVEASGRLFTPDGLTGMVHGATASGVVEDPTICPGKTFTWTARRVP